MLVGNCPDHHDQLDDVPVGVDGRPFCKGLELDLKLGGAVLENQVVDATLIVAPVPFLGLLQHTGSVPDRLLLLVLLL